MLHRYIARYATIEVAGRTDEMWIGIITDEDEPPELEELGELIPADGMTAAELSVVRHWVDLRVDFRFLEPRGTA